MDDMIIIFYGPLRPLPPAVRRFLKWLMCAFVLVVCVYVAFFLDEILKMPVTPHHAPRHATHHAH
jgi:hypothetical protein